MLRLRLSDNVRQGECWFSDSAGAVAILTALETADAALVMATADASGRTRREKIIKANPFL